jgi:hypothetical protein
MNSTASYEDRLLFYPHWDFKKSQVRQSDRII